MIRPMASNVSALSSVVAKGHQAIHFVSSTPTFHSVRRVFPGWKPVSSLRALPQAFPAAFDAESPLCFRGPSMRMSCFHRDAACLGECAGCLW